MSTEVWPWYVAGPLIGLMVPALLLVGNKMFGISSNLRHLCAAVAPLGVAHLKYDWRAERWNLVFISGILVGGFLGGWLLGVPAVAISPETRADLAALGVTNFSGLAPADLFAWSSLLTFKGFFAVVVGGYLVGFGTAYAGGCTSGHAISGLANFELPSLIAVMGFFIGGLLCTYVLLPFLFS